jgi:3-oxochol-4-en-24-oyl-CoA dehydrogenase
VPIATSPEQSALQASIREWIKRAGTLALVRGLEPGASPGGQPDPAAWADHWDALADLGIFSIALPAAAGGAGGTVADLAAAVEQLTYGLVPGPVLPTLLAGLVLRGHSDAPAAKELLPVLAVGQAPVAVGLAADTMTGVWLADGTLRVTGATGPVLGAGGTSHLILGAVAGGAGAVTGDAGVTGDTGDEVWFLIPAGHPGVQVVSCRPVDFSRPLARIRLNGAIVAPGDIVAGLATPTVRDLAATLLCTEAAAVAGFCSDTAAAYARTRHQFGRPIGSFQAVKHLCAGMLCRAERATAAAWDAARAADEAPGEHPLAAAAAAALALDAAVDNAKDCIQVLGGIGFTWEHDAHLYLRRAVAIRQLLGGSAGWRARAGELALAGARRQLRLTLGPAGAGTPGARVDGPGTGTPGGADDRGASADDGGAVDRGAGAVDRGAGAVDRGAGAVDRGASADDRGAGAVDRGAGAVDRGAGSVDRGAGSVGDGGTGSIAAAARSAAAAIAAMPRHRQRAALADAGYAAPHWPAPYGLSASPAALLVIDEELNRAGVTRPDLVIGGWAGPAIISHGTAAQRERFIGPTLCGEISWCQLFSEPDAGSDLASVRTRAVRVAGDGQAGGGWRLTGQKVWTSLAHEADWAICLARTDPGAPKHRGLTYFLVDMHSAGIDIRPLREITGRAAFNEVFLDEVFVPDDCVVGNCGDGWRIARSTLATERVAMGRGSALGDEVERLIGAVTGAGLAGDPAVQEQVGALVATGLAGSVLDLRSALAQLAGADDSQRAAVRKLVGVAHRQAVAETALTLSGPDGAASDGPAADAVHEFLLSRCLSIAGGTSQILLNVVAERALGLPREEAR